MQFQYTINMDRIVHIVIMNVNKLVHVYMKRDTK